MLGSIDAGFQLRIQDVVSHDKNDGIHKHQCHELIGSVLIDINVYYCTQRSDDGSASEKFVWTATHYEESDKRKYGMYRYRFSEPFELTDSIPFYHIGLQGLQSPGRNKAVKNKDFILCPKEKYLIEYFGTDWRTPRVFSSYSKALQDGEFNYIIPE